MAIFYIPNTTQYLNYLNNYINWLEHIKLGVWGKIQLMDLLILRMELYNKV